MVFAAGLGTRLRPLTDARPKALVEVAGKPLLWHVLHRLKAAGYGKFVVNVHHFADQIETYLSENRNFGLDIAISDERAALLDTGGGILHAKPLLLGNGAARRDGGFGRFLIHNVDILSNADFGRIDAEAAEAFGSQKAVACVVVSERSTKRYLLFDGDMRLCGWTNIETGEVRSPYGRIDPGKYRKLAFAGIHVASERIFGAFEEEGMSGAFPIIDFYLRICARRTVLGICPERLKLIDVGKLGSLPEAERFLAGNSGLTY